MDTADPWSVQDLSGDGVFALECEALALGWDEVAAMCRSERQRRELPDPDCRND